MNVQLALSRVSVGITVAALLLAGCKSSTAQQSGYKFELARASTNAGDGMTVTVRLDRADGTPVSGAKMFAVQSGPPRARKLVPLQPDGRGGYAYTSPELYKGGALHLAAEVQPDSALIWESVDLPR